MVVVDLCLKRCAFPGTRYCCCPSLLWEIIEAGCCNLEGMTKSLTDPCFQGVECSLDPLPNGVREIHALHCHFQGCRTFSELDTGTNCSCSQEPHEGLLFHHQFVFGSDIFAMKDIGQGWYLEGFLLAIQGPQCCDVDLSQRKVDIAFWLLVLVINPGGEPYLCLNRGDSVSLLLTMQAVLHYSFQTQPPHGRVVKSRFLVLWPRVAVPVFSITVAIIEMRQVMLVLSMLRNLITERASWGKLVAVLKGPLTWAFQRWWWSWKDRVFTLC